MEKFAFTEFEKMESSLGGFEYSKEFDKTDWIATEKIHGANMSFHTNGYEVHVARRRAFLKKEEHFFGHKAADFMTTYPDKTKEIFKLVVEHIGNIDVAQVTVYGELFGGKYAHEDYKAPAVAKKQKPVQQEIQYCPDVKFCAFDISYREMETQSEHVYIDYEVAMDIFEKVDMLYAKPIFQGKVNDCIHFKLGFNSTLPALFNLPPFEKGVNKAEGIVVKPLREIMSKTRSMVEERVILKLKRPDFAEWGTPKQNEEKNSNKAPKKMPSLKNVGGRPDKVLIPRFASYVNDNRVTSGITKIGFPDSDEVKDEIVTEVYNDVLFDAMADEGEVEKLWNACSDKQKKVVENCIRAKILSSLRKRDAAKEEADDFF